MFGFVFGTFCLLALIFVLKSELRKKKGGWHHHHGQGHHGFFGKGFGRCSKSGESFGIGRNPFIRGLFQELDTTPGQEKAIKGALDEFFGTVKSTKKGLFESRGQLADVFRSESFDETSMSVVVERPDEALDKVRTAFVDGIAKIYSALDPKQRARVADWLEKGPRGRSWGPYRTAPKDNENGEGAGGI